MLKLDGPILDTNGVVIVFDNGRIVAFVHPYTYRDLCGQEAYEALLSGPRVASPYGEIG